MTIKELREKAMKLPLSPGVYIMKNKQEEIIYIGKAKALRNRVSQYFGSEKNHQERCVRWLRMLIILTTYFVLVNLKPWFWNAVL